MSFTISTLSSQNLKETKNYTQIPSVIPSARNQVLVITKKHTPLFFWPVHSWPLSKYPALHWHAYAPSVFIMYYTILKFMIVDAWTYLYCSTILNMHHHGDHFWFLVYAGRCYNRIAVWKVYKFGMLVYPSLLCNINMGHPTCRR